MISQQTTGIHDAPIHPLGALITVILDLFWSVIEIPATMSVAFLPTIIPLSIVLGLLCWASVSLIQKFVAKDEWGTSIAKGLAMGIVAGVPYLVVGTVVGIPLLLWSGIYRAQKLLTARES
jgi:hypothetical protein